MSFLMAARASNGAICYQGTIPWHAPHDLKQFASLTRGAILIMGRATFESLPGHLPGRVSIVIGSRRPSTDAAHRFSTFDEAVRCALSRSEEHTSELQSLIRPSYALFCFQ